MEFPLTFADAVLACGIVLIGAILQGSVGFGLGPFAVPLLILIDARFVPGPLLLTALLLTLLMSFRERRDIDKDGLKWALGGRLLGTVLGAALLLLIPAKALTVLFGIMVLVAVGLSSGGFHLPANVKNLFGAGTLSGLMGTTAAIGGAPMALVYQQNRGPVIRATLSTIFVIGTILSIISLIIIGKFTLTELLMAIILMPGSVLGFLFSKRTASLLDRGFMRTAILFTAAFSAIIVIVLRAFNF